MTSPLTTLSPLEQYELNDLNHPHNQSLVGEESFKGPVTTRVLKDKPWLFSALLFFVLFVAVCVWLINLGSVHRLAHPSDFRSELCGTDHLHNFPFQYFLQPLVDPKVRMCVSKCPSETGPSICLYDRNMAPTPYCYTQLKTFVVQNVCMPSEPLNRRAISKYLMEQSIVQSAMGTVYSTRWILTLALLASLLSAYLLTRLLDSSVRLVIWGSVWLAILSWPLLGSVARQEYHHRVSRECLFAKDLYSCAQPFTYSLLNLSYLFFILGPLHLILAMTKYNKINLTVSLLQSALKTTQVLRPIRLLPFVLLIPGLGISLLTTYALFGLFSTGSYVRVAAQNIDGNQVRIFHYPSYLPPLALPLLFGWLLLLRILKRIAEMTNSLALCIWYFTKHKLSLLLPTTRVLTLPLRYHLGSIFKLSTQHLLLARAKWFCQLVTCWLRKRPQHTALTRCLSWSAWPILYAHHHLLRFISAQSFVHISLWGDSLSLASQKNFFLQHRNREVTREVDDITTYVLLMMRAVCSLVGSTVYCLVLKYNSASAPALAGVLFTWFMSFQLAAIVVDQHFIISKTVILCYYMDNEMYIADQRYVEPFVEDYMHLFTNIAKGGKQIEVETFLPQNIPETNRGLEEGGQEHLQVVTEKNRKEELVEYREQSVRESKYDQYGKPKEKKKKVGFLGNGMFDVARAEEDYDPFSNDQFK